MLKIISGRRKKVLYLIILHMIALSTNRNFRCVITIRAAKTQLISEGFFLSSFEFRVEN